MSTETEISQGAVYSARPVIEINDTRDEMVQTLLLGMIMHETEGGLSSLELSFVNTASIANEGIDLAFEYSDTDLMSLGNSIKIFSGDEDDPQEIFRGVISCLEFKAGRSQHPELNVLAEDALQKARMTRITKLHNGTLAEITERITEEMGLRPVIDGLTIDVEPQMQLNESNLAFLRRLLSRYDADLQIVADELHVSLIADVRRNAITLELGSQLKKVRAVADLSNQVTFVTYSGWDIDSGQHINVTSDTQNALGPGSGRTGSQILDEKMSERIEHIDDKMAADEAEAQSLVNASYAKRARQFVQIDATAEGNPGLRVGSHVTLQGIGPRFENTYYVTKVCHRYDLTDGYQTDFTAGSSFFGG